MLLERIDQEKRSLVADYVLEAESKKGVREFEHLLKPHGSGIRGLAIGAVLSLGFWIALGMLIWALTR